MKEQDFQQAVDQAYQRRMDGQATDDDNRMLKHADREGYDYAAKHRDTGRVKYEVNDEDVTDQVQGDGITPGAPQVPADEPDDADEDDEDTEEDDEEEEGDNYDESQPADLRAELNRRSLPTTGNKPQLVSRLRADDAK